MTPLWNESLLGTLGRWGIVLLVLFVLLLLSAFPFQVAHLGDIRPAFMLMAIYYWTIMRPSLLPPLVTFFIGLILDLVSSYPLGMNAFVFVIVQWLTQSQRKFLLGQSFIVIWAGFFLLALGAGIVQWLLFSLFNLTLVSIKLMLVSVFLSSFLFPLMALPLALVHKALAQHPSSMP